MALFWQMMQRYLCNCARTIHQMTRVVQKQSFFSLSLGMPPLISEAALGIQVKPGGQVLLLEHSRSGFAPLSWYQDITADAVAASGKGCYWNQACHPSHPPFHAAPGSPLQICFPLRCM